MTASIDTIRSDFSLLDDWEDRYRYVIELGQDLPPYPEAVRDEAHKVRGCASQVWLHGEKSGDQDPVLTYQGDSDAHIVRGLVAIVLALYSGRHASEILTVDFDETMRELGLNEHLSPQRSNGLRSMVQRIRSDAQAAAG
ncbi:SufE family protein [Tianweitania sp. BSSL-BM11]|uniref:SufE family protein n=1 Tax=Tianweitania aestuarii TaxID=2814886 RepID=A0ABS5RS43_9HYPH|nr:SufE family protein [Tianweitania aestuarii]MBS9719868.1 SufE family protein [Tianweitania aestuarii]